MDELLFVAGRGGWNLFVWQWDQSRGLVKGKMLFVLFHGGSGRGADAFDISL